MDVIRTLILPLFEPIINPAELMLAVRVVDEAAGMVAEVGVTDNQFWLPVTLAEAETLIGDAVVFVS